ncbi:hypothetical protein [Mucilaginibacter sp. L196]|uniref:hypothetical protein n=1 Tax=Mucilaginibacter sp. L196 TaxID=1641870 RepID=UPI001C203895|nr:hypothetical protein [Mucilaginibacter sp. L196]
MIKPNPSLILGSIVLGLLMIWAGSSFDFANSFKITLLFGGALLVMAACGYCGYQLYKIISGKF